MKFLLYSRLDSYLKSVICEIIIATLRTKIESVNYFTNTFHGAKFPVRRYTQNVTKAGKSLGMRLLSVIPVPWVFYVFILVYHKFVPCNSQRMELLIIEF